MSTENKLEKRFDPTDYQWEERGKVHMLADLSREDLIQVACAQMDILEEVDLQAADLTSIMEKWRKKEIFPKTNNSEKK